MNQSETRAYFDSEAFRRDYHTDVPLGSFVTADGTRFALWAPTAQRVTLCLYRDCFEWDPYARIEMKRYDKGLWQHRTERILEGVYYGYEVEVDGVKRWTGDPYARACGLNGWRSMVVNLTKTNPPGWEQDRAPARGTEEIIWETHVKDFSWDPASGVSAKNRGKYLAFTETKTKIGVRGRKHTCVAYLKALDVTHVQLQPIYDYGSVDEGNDSEVYNWGYDPVNYNVPEGSYASDAVNGEVRIRELKAAVQALHENGLRVIMDVVYNHTYNLDNPLFKTVPWYFYRQQPDGSAGNGSGCGTEIASERSMCARYILDSVLYWAEEYHIDGFRFDLMGLHDVALMNRIRKALNERYGEGEKLVFGEPWCGGQSNERAGTAMAHKGNLKMLDRGVGAFCDNTRDAVKGGLFDAASAGMASGGGLDAGRLADCIRGWAGSEARFPYAAPSQTITYLSSHDDWTLWDKLVYTLGGGKYFAQMREEILRANRLAAAINFCCQGRVFMLSGEEFARTKLGIRNSYRTSIRINRLDWKRAYRNRALVDYYRGLIALRKTLPALNDKSETAADRLLEVMQIARDAAAIRMDNRGTGKSRYSEILLAFNGGREPCELALPQGKWEVLCDGKNSFAHEHPHGIRDMTVLEPISALILGRR
ncbi:MAG: type I pullulanase [Clostridia bacterium]|nr:type I pullulanase [Clostridia bacterium]